VVVIDAVFDLVHVEVLRPHWAATLDLAILAPPPLSRSLAKRIRYRFLSSLARQFLVLAILSTRRRRERLGDTRAGGALDAYWLLRPRWRPS
jgi:hypothetical protein